MKRNQETDLHSVEKSTLHFDTKMKMLRYGKLEEVMDFLKAQKSMNPDKCT